MFTCVSEEWFWPFYLFLSIEKRNLISNNKLDCIFIYQLAPTKSDSVLDAMKKVKNPHQMCEKLHLLVQGLTTQLKDMINDKVMDSKSKMYF